MAPSLLVAVYGCEGGNHASTFDDQQKAYSACIDQQTTSLGTAAATTNDATKGPFSVRLNPTDLTTVSRVMRDSLKAQMKQNLESQRIATIATLRCEAFKPTASPYESADGGAVYNASASAGSKSTGPEDDSAHAQQASTTNNQVAGVDEADFVKNDTKYIYVVQNSSFRIIDAFPGNGMHQIASVNVPGTAKKLFVEGNRALVYSSVPKVVTDDSSYPNYGPYGSYGSYGSTATECTYGESGCVPAGDGTETEISIFDISNIAAPTLIRSIHSSSSLVAARRIGNTVHTVLAQDSNGTGYSTQYPSVTTQSEPEINAAYAAQETTNAAAIDAAPVESASIPKFTDSTNRGITNGLYASSMPDGTALTSVLSLDMASDADLSIATVIGRSGWVYASDSALYMAVPHQQVSGWGWYDGQDSTVKELSTIHKFTLGAAPGATAYVGSGVVKGRVLNELAMDEKDGFLRVATTTGYLPDPNAHNTLSVLDAQLNETGEIDQIAPGEDIRATRFDGDKGYVVTFKKTDPLFVFDLKDPHAPKQVGELKIPGFSTYIHMMDDTHLLTIGYDAADQGDFAWFTSIILQIFDVSNPTAPALLHKESIGTRGSSSAALTNHLAFTYFAPKNLLALPMTICEGGDRNGNYGNEMTFSGLMVYDVTVADGFKLHGKVSHPSNATCDNWWADATSDVQRSIIMDDWVYSVSAERVKANNLTNLSVDAAEVDLGTPTDEQP